MVPLMMPFPVLLMVVLKFFSKFNKIFSISVYEILGRALLAFKARNEKLVFVVIQKRSEV